MAPRVKLQELLEELIGSSNVYFQPPANIKMNYPCIVYKRDYIWQEYADNSPYSNTKRYLLSYIDRNPDSNMVDKLANLPLCNFNRNYVADNLNHDVFDLYF